MSTVQVQNVSLAITASSEYDSQGYRPWAVFVDTIPGAYLSTGTWSGGIPAVIVNQSSGSTMQAPLGNLTPGIHMIYFVIGSDEPYSGAIEIEEQGRAYDFANVTATSAFTIQLDLASPPAFAPPSVGGLAASLQGLTSQISMENATVTDLANLIQNLNSLVAQNNALQGQILAILTKVNVAGMVTGTTDYLTIQSAGSFQRLYGNLQPQPKFILGGSIQNLSPDPLTVKFSTAPNIIATGVSGQATILNPAQTPGFAGGSTPVPNINADTVGILGATLGDGYAFTWYA